MSIQLSPENDAFLQGEISRGTYRDVNEAIDAGLELLRQRKELLNHLAESRRQLDNGEYVEYDEEGLARWFEELKIRVRSGAAVSDNA